MTSIYKLNCLTSSIPDRVIIFNNNVFIKFYHSTFSISCNTCGLRSINHTFSSRFSMEKAFFRI
ncbi:hypothetical protein LDVICp193 [lymphocystis disease virus-China]|uniref:Uncharacterized protein n=1 Tax=lymphocystis disease virus-China TaxID=256729 RepID=Q677S1_9VIRU|nr:hypothetical protein LDVICp193 [lymphocystis disease virus-China]AAU11036.1 hypothetical protein [lymphocystis disease virus-China]